MKLHFRKIDGTWYCEPKRNTDGFVYSDFVIGKGNSTKEAHDNYWRVLYQPKWPVEPKSLTPRKWWMEDNLSRH